MRLPDYLKSRLIGLWARAVAPFRPSTLTTVVVLVAASVFGIYDLVSPTRDLRDMSVTRFADQIRIQAAQARPPAENRPARRAFNGLSASLAALHDAASRSLETKQALAEVAAYAALLARHLDSENARKLAAITRDRALAEGTGPGALAARITALASGSE